MPGKRKRHGHRTSHVSAGRLGYPTASSVAHTHVSRLRIVNLPAELGILILSFVLPQGHAINISHALNSAESRRFEREAAILNGKPAKRKQTLRAPTAVLRSCKYLARCGTTALWNGNTFVFDTMEYVRRFLDTAPSELKDLVRDVAIGEGYFAHAPHIHEEWPANLGTLSGFTKLSKLTLFAGDLQKTDLARLAFPSVESGQPPSMEDHTKFKYWVQLSDIPEWRRPVYSEEYTKLWLPKRLLEVLLETDGDQEKLARTQTADDDGFGFAALEIARDYMLKTVPEAVLKSLSSLTIKYLDPQSPMGWAPWYAGRQWHPHVWLEVSALRHAKHLSGLQTRAGCEICEVPSEEALEEIKVV